MEKDKPTGVDPVTLTECFAIYTRVNSGVTRYLRDDEDTYSPMMNRLRADGCKIESVVNAFLAIQRFLSLRGLEDHLFRYSNRVLFIVLSMEAMVIDQGHHSNGEPSQVPFLEDPENSSLSAAFFMSLAQPEHEWDAKSPQEVRPLMLSVIEGMENMVGDEELTFEFQKQIFDGVEEATIPDDSFQIAPSKTVH